MRNPLKKKDAKIDLTADSNGEKKLTKADEIVQNAQDIADSRAGGKQDKKSEKAGKAPRRTDQQIEEDKLKSELKKAVDKALSENFAAALKLLTYGAAKVANDKTWIATDDESEQLSVCFRGYLDLKRPGWGTESPAAALTLAILAFTLPRLAPHKRQPIDGNTWAGWLPKLWSKIKPGKAGFDDKPTKQSSGIFRAREEKPTSH